MSASPNPRRGLGLRVESARPSLERSPEVKTRAHTVTATAAARRERSRTRIAPPPPAVAVVAARASRRRHRQIPFKVVLPVGKSGEDDFSESGAAI